MAQSITIRVLSRIPHPGLSRRDVVDLEVEDRVPMPGLLLINGQVASRVSIVAHSDETTEELCRTVADSMPDYYRALAERGDIVAHYRDPITVVDLART